jgi:hypothetical protein
MRWDTVHKTVPQDMAMAVHDRKGGLDSRLTAYRMLDSDSSPAPLDSELNSDLAKV